MYKRWKTLSKCYIYKNMSHTFSLSDRKCSSSAIRLQYRKEHLPKNLHFSESVLLNSRMPRHSCCEVRVMQLHDILLLRTSASLHSVSVGAKPLSTGQCAPCRRLYRRIILASLFYCTKKQRFFKPLLCNFIFYLSYFS